MVDNAISDYNLEDYTIRQLAYLIMKPNLLSTEREQFESLRFQAPAKSALAQSSKALL